ASQQIILDLKGKIEFEDKAIKTANIIEVEEALRALGYKAKEIKKVLPKLDTSKKTSDLIKDALAMMLK
ncbi:MAG: Holliday junction branch migration protein RuvA, partial [Tenericutes bacterium]|nr:Holliday junction branch migration protein RuvA [Mycoplasmatota bacterium]